MSVESNESGNSYYSTISMKDLFSQLAIIPNSNTPVGPKLKSSELVSKSYETSQKGFTMQWIRITTVTNYIPQLYYKKNSLIIIKYQ